MVGIKSKLIISFFILSFLLAPMFGVSQTAGAEEDTKAAGSSEDQTAQAESSQNNIDQEALDILKEMSDALSSIKEFSFDTEITNDVTYDNGQPIQISGTLQAIVKRPSHVYAKYEGDANSREVWYSRDKLTLYIADTNFYGELKTPETIDSTMDFLIDNYDFSLPLADILNADPYKSFMETTNGGFVVGDSKVDGKECTHLAFTAEYVDWQIWVSNDDPALPCKLVINYKQIEGVPQYQAVFSNWKVNHVLSKSVFTPKLPKDAVKIDFINFKKDKEVGNEEK